MHQSKSEIKNVLLPLASICMTFVLLIMPIQNDVHACVIIVIVALISVVVALDAFLHKRILSLLYLLLMLELLVVLGFLIFVCHLPETSWRANYATKSLNYASLSFISLAILIFNFVYFLFSGKSNRSAKTSLRISGNIDLFLVPEWLIVVICFVELLMLLYMVGYSGLFTARDYSVQSSSLVKLYRVIQLLLVILYFLGYIQKTNFIKLLSGFVIALCFACDIVLALFGYRYFLVEIVLVIFTIAVFKRNISLKSIILIFILAILFYFLLSIIGEMRSNLDLHNLDMDAYFKHERNIFYSLNAMILNRPSFPEINTYLNALINILPFISDTAFQENTGRILLPFIHPELYDSSLMTMGAFLLTEAYYNYGFLGIVLVSCLIASIIGFFELKLKNSPVLFLVYCYVCAEIYSVVYYGTSNWIAGLLVFVVLVLLIYLFRTNKKNKK